MWAVPVIVVEVKVVEVMVVVGMEVVMVVETALVVMDNLQYRRKCRPSIHTHIL